MTQQKRCGPKGGTKNPRLQEARRLRKNGKTDSELLALGFTRNEIARSFVPNSVSIHVRCRVCGSLAIVDADKVCMACELIAKLKREGRQDQEPFEIVQRGRPPIERPLNLDHPAILKPKGS